jgi:HPt (histidine-containing phosphotransfer) domain-containing protein
MAESEAIDRAALQDLLATTGGDPSFLAELIDTFVEDTTTLLVAMRQALATGNAEKLRRAAHSVKSNSASFGALTLATLCKELEEMARTGALDGVAARMARVEAEYEKIKGALQAARPTG